MNISNQEPQQDLQHIKNMMERSSRFISLSGLSGVAAGLCALIGAYFARNIIHEYYTKIERVTSHANDLDRYKTTFISQIDLEANLILVAVVTFIAAFSLSFLFTYLRSKKTNTQLWGSTSKRLLINVMIPLVAGGIYILKLIQIGTFGLIAPGCLIFYGLALVNASKFTLGEVRYLGYLQIILGIINLWFIGYGIYFWAAGFGVLHIVYGVFMWNKYERN